MGNPCRSSLYPGTWFLCSLCTSPFRVDACWCHVPASCIKPISVDILMAAMLPYACCEFLYASAMLVVIDEPTPAAPWGPKNDSLQRSSSRTMEDDADLFHGGRDPTRVRVPWDVYEDVWSGLLRVSWSDDQCEGAGCDSHHVASIWMYLIWGHQFQNPFHILQTVSRSPLSASPGRLDAIDHVLLRKKQPDDHLAPAEPWQSFSAEIVGRWK